MKDQEIVRLYRQWSEEHWAAGFMMLPDDGSLPAEFISWLQETRQHSEWTNYEFDLIQRYREWEVRH